jgi:hypothetical protein
MPEADIVFNHKAGMYVADWSQYRDIFTTTTNTIYTKVQEEQAKQAYELLRTSGFPSIAEAIHLLQDGNIVNLPNIIIEDLRRAYEIFGTPPEFIRGRMTKRKSRESQWIKTLFCKRKNKGWHQMSCTSMAINF